MNAQSTRLALPEQQAFIDAMRCEGLPEELIDTFCTQYRRYRRGDAGKLAWPAISAPIEGDIVDYSALPEPDARRSRELGNKLAIVKLNGGLGTTMQLSGPKSLIPVRQGRSFLRIIADHTLHLRDTHGCRLPLLLMNSFRTREPSLAALSGFEQPSGLPLDFLQHKVPRIDRRSNLPARLSAEESWAPPGHGDVYLALRSSGVLERLLQAGYEWAFVSNADNLGATVDLRIVEYLEQAGLDFAMEVTRKAAADRKGGTLVRHDGKLTLLERAQVEPARMAQFEDIDTFPVFNTNNLWWRLDAVSERLRAGGLSLPMMVNPKQVEGVDVVQLETAMGAAIGCFEKAIGVNVSRRRFAPVKATCDLLAVRSDAYLLDDEAGLRPSPARALTEPPLVDLDERFFDGLEDFEQRCAAVPSLVGCSKLTVKGDVRFEDGVVIEGDVTIVNSAPEQRTVPKNSVLRHETMSL